MKTVPLELVSILSTGLVLVLLSTIQVAAQPLVMNTPTNIAINPNGTVSISTEGATDTDMNVFPPEGVTVVIENDTVTVTNQTVDVETAEEEEDNDETEDEEEESEAETEDTGTE